MMTTHEREIMEAVDLCRPDGSLNPDAIGWSRFPLHRANLGGEWGRNKRWDYWAILAGDFIVSAVYSDVDRIGLADVYWADLDSGEHGGHGIVTPRSADIVVPEVCGSAAMRVARHGLELTIDEVADATHITAVWTERDGRPGALDVVIERPPTLESVNVVIPWSVDEFNFTSKQIARPAHGHLQVGAVTRAIGGAAGEAWGILDVGRGRWPHEITWNWGAGCGTVATADGPTVVGVQFGAKWTDGTGHTENGFVIDGRLTKVGRELEWTYDWDAPLAPWRVVDAHGQIDVTLHPRFDKVTDTGGGAFGSQVHQVFGTWTGSVCDDAGRRVEFSGLQGFAEEARQRW